MLRIYIKGEELWDEVNEKFITIEGVELDLEHSLVSLSKWESKFEKPFLGKETKTTEEILWYIRMMIVTPNVPEEVLNRLSVDNLKDVNAYIESKQSATTFSEIQKASARGETITAELIYFWMVSFHIPFECQYWHLNRLFSLIRVCGVKNSKPKKMSRREVAERNRQLNAQRKAQMGTSG